MSKVSFQIWKVKIQVLFYAVGLDSTSYSPHIFRRGGATFAYEAKVPSEFNN